MKKLLSILVILFYCFSCIKPYKEKIIDYNKIFTIRTSPQTIAADGFSLVKIVVLTSDTAIIKNLKVSFQCSAGTLFDNDALFTNDSAFTFLRVSQDTSKYDINVIVKNGDKQIFQSRKHLIVQTAWPDSLFIDQTKATYALNDNNLIFKTFLYRKNGKPSTSLTVEYSAFQLNSQNSQVAVGRFAGIHNNYSKAEGTFDNVQFFSDTRDIDTNKAIIVRAKTLRDNNNYISKDIRLQYKK